MNNSEKLSLFRKGNSGSVGLTDVTAGGAAGSDTLMISFRQVGNNNNVFIPNSGGPVDFFYWANGNGNAYRTCNGTTSADDIVWNTNADGTKWADRDWNHLDQRLGFVAQLL